MFEAGSSLQAVCETLLKKLFMRHLLFLIQSCLLFPLKKTITPPFVTLPSAHISLLPSPSNRQNDFPVEKIWEKN
jgi:hypothetical protein